MHDLYGSRPGTPRRLVATFDSEAQLSAYVRWATLAEHGGIRQFEKGSSLAGFHEFSYSGEPVTTKIPRRPTTTLRRACCDRIVTPARSMPFGATDNPESACI
jgi:hypothetical protein